MVPDPGSLVIYGIPVILIGSVIVYIWRYFRPSVPEESIRLFQAAWVVAGYLLSTNLPNIEQFWPTMPAILPQIIISILLFGGMLGFQAGDVYWRYYYKIFQRAKIQRMLSDAENKDHGQKFN